MDEIQRIPGTRQLLKLSLVVTWKNVPVEENAIVGPMIQAFGKCAGNHTFNDSGVDWLLLICIDSPQRDKEKLRTTDKL